MTHPRNQTAQGAPYLYRHTPPSNTAGAPITAPRQNPNRAEFRAQIRRGIGSDRQPGKEATADSEEIRPEEPTQQKELSACWFSPAKSKIIFFS